MGTGIQACALNSRKIPTNVYLYKTPEEKKMRQRGVESRGSQLAEEQFATA